MIDQLSEIADIIAVILGVISAVILLSGVVIALWKLVHGILFEKHTKGEDLTVHHVNPVRVELGRYMTLALEFLIAKDILETLFEPQWEDIGQLAALVAIRSAVGFFLMYEIDKIQKNRK